MTHSPDPDIVVVGAGIAGLVAAVTAAEGGARVVLVESNSPGGRAKTVEREGYRYNVGPHALYLGGHLLPYLATRGLAPSGGLPDTKHVRLLRDGRLWDLTANPVAIARTKLLAPRSRARILTLMARLPRMDTAPFVGTSWAEWLGNQPADVAGVAAMFVRTGSYVNAADTYDAGAALDQFKLALIGVRYLDGGWQTMVDAMLARFGSLGGQLLADRTVTAVGADGGVELATSAGPLRARAAILAGLGPDAVERLIGAPVAGRANLGAAVHASALDLALRRPHPGLVFGIDEPLYLSPHAPTARVAPNGGGLVSMLRYAPVGETDGPDPAAVKARFHALATMAGLDHDDIVHERYLHSLLVANGHPIAAGGGLAGRPSVDASGFDGVFLAGDWVGPRFQLADASSASGEAAAGQALAHIRRSTRVGV
ncbi:MAG: Dehydrogenase [Ilumatobacteraceae bacterium]|nr:Dehydrogenase [Ilumatobacteraceae bacterium]